MQSNWRRSGLGLCHLFILASARLLFAASGPAATADFTMSANVSSLSLTAGGVARSIEITATALRGFNEPIDVTMRGLPAGVNASPASFTLQPGKPRTVSLAADAAAAGQVTLVFKGTASALHHRVLVGLGIKIDAVTHHYDHGRTGLNASETILTPARVNARKFGLLRILRVDGVVDAEPLVISNLFMRGRGRDVVYVVTEHDSIYAFDADTGARLWKHSALGENETTASFGCDQISPEIGITATPVIDRSFGPHGAIFFVAMSEDQGGNYHQRLHALDIVTGLELGHSPTEVSATYSGNGPYSAHGIVAFEPKYYAGRAGLLLLNGIVYMGWTSHCDGGPYTGWLMGYSESTLAQTGVLNLTPNGSQGSIWMSGSGLAADKAGNIYFLDANGTFDPQLNAKGFPVEGDYGNGFIKVSTANGKLFVADYFETSATVNESDRDQDLGSGGVLLLPDIEDEDGLVHRLAVGAGKDQNIYVVNRDSMGKFNPKNNAAIYQELSQANPGGVWSTPAYFDHKVYYAPQGGTLKAFPIVNAKLETPRFQSENSFEYPGATPSITAHGTKNGIVWAVENSSPAVLHAYAAETLAELYNSAQAAHGRDNFGDGNKFITPMAANGKVFVGTPSGVAVFGLLY